MNKLPKKSFKEGTISVLQIEKRLRKNQLAYVAALIEIKLEKEVEVFDAIVLVLQEYANVMPLELLKKLPPRRLTNHHIKLVPRAKLPAQVPY